VGVEDVDVSDVVYPTEEIRVMRVLNDGLFYGRYGGHTRSDPWGLWVRAKLRKPTRCIATGLELAPGDSAFRPVGNPDYRAKRISAAFVKACIDEWRKEGAINDDGTIRPLDKGED
jgi:hypothetical protein